MKGLFSHLLSFDRVNWWLLAGGLMMNISIAAACTILGAWWSMSQSTTTFYANFGAPLMLAAVFVACLLSGMMISRMADDVPLRHAFLSSLGAAAAFVVGALLTLNYMLLMFVLVAMAGNLNGAMLALPRPHARR